MSLKINYSLWAMASFFLFSFSSTTPWCPDSPLIWDYIPIWGKRKMLKWSWFFEIVVIKRWQLLFNVSAWQNKNKQANNNKTLLARLREHAFSLSSSLVQEIHKSGNQTIEFQTNKCSRLIKQIYFKILKHALLLADFHSHN